MRFRHTWVIATATLAAMLSALPAQAVVLVGPWDFSDPSQYGNNFVEKFNGGAISHSTDDDANGIAGDGGFVRLADGANVSTIGSVLYDPGADGIDVPAFGDFLLDFDARTDTSRGTIGVFFRGATLTNTAMVHIALDSGAGGEDQVRFYSGSNINTGAAGTLLDTNLADTTLTSGDWNHVRLTVQNVLEGATPKMNAMIELFDYELGLDPGTPLMTASYTYSGFLSDGSIALRPHSGNVSGIDSRWSDFDNFTISEILEPVPEPASLWLLAGASLGLLALIRRK